MRLLLLVITAIVLFQACGGKASPKTTPFVDGAVPVKLLSISSDSNTSGIEASGLLATENEARLSFKVGGIIDNMYVKEGQAVKKGQLLATLKLNEVSAQVEQVNLSIAKAQRDYQRTLHLYNDSVATLEQLQNSKTNVDIARQSLQQAAFNQQHARIYAPADGYIVKKTGNPGELASAAVPVIAMNMVSKDSKWVLKVGVPDREWAIIEKGDKAIIKLDAFPGENFTAVVSNKSFAADPVSGAFSVELQLNMGKHLPASGIFGRATIYPEQPANRMSIPYESLLEANGKQGFVFVSDDKKTVRKVAVTIGEIKENRVYITNGLEGHQFIVTAGSPYLADKGAIVVRE